MKEWYDVGAGAGREGIGLGKTGTASGDDMGGSVLHIICFA